MIKRVNSKCSFSGTENVLTYFTTQIPLEQRSVDEERLAHFDSELMMDWLIETFEVKAQRYCVSDFA